MKLSHYPMPVGKRDSRRSRHGIRIHRSNAPSVTSQSHFRHDAAAEVTSLSDVFGNVKQRYVYDAYGQATALTSVSAVTGDGYAWQYTHQGGRLDLYTGLIRHGVRDFSVSLGRWVEQDPAGYVDGGNLYEYERSDPSRWTDALGLATPQPISETFTLTQKFTNQGANTTESTELKVAIMEALDKFNLKEFITQLEQHTPTMCSSTTTLGVQLSLIPQTKGQDVFSLQLSGSASEEPGGWGLQGQLHVPLGPLLGGQASITANESYNAKPDSSIVGSSLMFSEKWKGGFELNASLAYQRTDFLDDNKLDINKLLFSNKVTVPLPLNFRAAFSDQYNLFQPHDWGAGIDIMHPITISHIDSKKAQVMIGLHYSNSDPGHLKTTLDFVFPF